MRLIPSKSVFGLTFFLQIISTRAWNSFLFQFCWQISKILQYSPSVSFLNLSFNHLSSPLMSSCVENSFRFPLLPRLSILILIGTNISWDAIWFILRHANTLQEFHLSLNNFSSVDISKLKKSFQGRKAEISASIMTSGEEDSNSGSPPISATADRFLSAQVGLPHRHRVDSTDSGHGSSGSGSSSDEDDSCLFPYLRRLMFDGNPITCWGEVSKLGTYKLVV